MKPVIQDWSLDIFWQPHSSDWFYVTSSYTKLVIYGQQQVKADLDDGSARLQACVAKDDLVDLHQDHLAPVINHPPSFKHLDHLIFFSVGI